MRIAKNEAADNTRCQQCGRQQWVLAVMGKACKSATDNRATYDGAVDNGIADDSFASNGDADNVC